MFHKREKQLIINSQTDNSDMHTTFSRKASASHTVCSETFLPAASPGSSVSQAYMCTTCITSSTSCITALPSNGRVNKGDPPCAVRSRCCCFPFIQDLTNTEHCRAISIRLRIFSDGTLEGFPPSCLPAPGQLIMIILNRKQLLSIPLWSARADFLMVCSSLPSEVQFLGERHSADLVPAMLVPLSRKWTCVATPAAFALFVARKQHRQQGAVPLEIHLWFILHEEEAPQCNL